MLRRIVPPADQDISAPRSTVRVFVLRAQEDWAIAGECWKLATAPGAAQSAGGLGPTFDAFAAMSRAVKPRMQKLALLLGCLGFDLVNYDRLRAASFINLAACRYFVSGKGQKLRVLSARWSGVGNRPVDGSVVRENDEL